jgi:hypothetical protein
VRAPPDAGCSRSGVDVLDDANNLSRPVEAGSVAGIHLAMMSPCQECIPAVWRTRPLSAPRGPLSVLEWLINDLPSRPSVRPSVRRLQCTGKRSKISMNNARAVSPNVSPSSSMYVLSSTLPCDNQGKGQCEDLSYARSHPHCALYYKLKRQSPRRCTRPQTSSECRVRFRGFRDTSSLNSHRPSVPAPHRVCGPCKTRFRIKARAWRAWPRRILAALL